MFNSNIIVTNTFSETIIYFYKRPRNINLKKRQSGMNSVLLNSYCIHKDMEYAYIYFLIDRYTYKYVFSSSENPIEFLEC